MSAKSSTLRFFARAQPGITALTDLVVASLTATGLVSSATLNVSGAAAVGTITAGGQRVLPYLPVAGTKIANYSANIGELVAYNPTAGVFDLTLPNAVGNAGLAVTFYNITSDTTAVTWKSVAGNIDGAVSGTYSSGVANHRQTFISDGANWWAFPTVA